MVEGTGYDWELAKREYESGQLSVMEISRQVGCHVSTLKSKARDKGWKRAGREDVRELTRDLLLEGGTDSSGGQEGGSVGGSEGVLLAARRAVDVIQGHRQRLGTLGRVTDRLLRTLDEATDPAATPAVRASATSLLVTDKQTLIDAFLKVSNGVAKLLPLERQAFDLDDSRELANLSDEAILKKACGEDVMNKLMPTVEDDDL